MGFKSEPHVPSGAAAARRQLFVVKDGVPLPARAKIAVLYIEDDADDIFLIGHQLSALTAFEVEFTHVSTIAEARAAIARTHFDVILCDFWLASETTVTFIGELKATAGTKPIILVSAFENDDIELIGRRAGVDGFVAKADLTSASLGRVFNTLLVPRSPVEAETGAAGWLKALMRSLDRAHAIGDHPDEAGLDETTRTVIDAILGQSDQLRAELVDKLAGLERAMQADRNVSRFDMVPHLRHGIRRQMARCRVGATIAFSPPELPVSIEASPVLFGDILDGFLAEAGEAVANGLSVSVSLAVDRGELLLTLTCVSRVGRMNPIVPIAAAVVAERRFLIETLARAGGGSASFPTGDRREIARLNLPLRQ
jgi:CheY-like chemotaxis protein